MVPEHLILPVREFNTWSEFCSWKNVTSYSSCYLSPDAFGPGSAKRRANAKPKPVQDYIIYALVDPRGNKDIFYVGCTVNIKRRLKEHTHKLEATSHCMEKRIASILEKGKKPEMLVLERTQNPNREEDWITFFVDQPRVKLLNISSTKVF